MNASVLPLEGPPAAMTRASRTLFWIVCAGAVATMWLAPHLPQVDLPQHAGQIALLREAVSGHLPWPEELRLNWLTPYLVGYLPLLALSFAMPIESAIAVLYTLTFVGFVAACIGLRQAAGADERLDWLALPSFFGLAWQWGFVTFLAALPLGVLFIALSLRFVDAPTTRRALGLLALGAALLVAHGLVFLHAVPIGLAMAVHAACTARTGRWQRLLPYVALLAGFALYKVGVLDRELGQAPHGGVVMWGGPLDRLRALVLHPMSSKVRNFPPAVPLVLLGWAAPWLLGLRPSPGWRVRIPFLWTLGMVLLYPNYVAGATNFYDRFAVLLLPTYAAMFGARAGQAPRLSPRVVTALLAAASVLVVAREAFHGLAFAREVRPVDALFARMPPRQRVLYVPLDPYSPATRLDFAYLHYPLWYQARHGGLVEFNFATLLPQIVRFRDFRRHVLPEASWQPATALRWSRFEHEPYAYVLYRSRGRPPEAVRAGQRCALVPVDEAPGGWWLYRNECLR